MGAPISSPISPPEMGENGAPVSSPISFWWKLAKNVKWEMKWVNANFSLRLNFAFHNTDFTTQFLVEIGLRAEL